MAEEPLPAGSQSLEDGPAAPPEAPAAPAAPPEPQAVDVGGQQMVPLSALLAERTEKKTLKERTGQLEQFYNQAKPYVDFINSNPHLLRQPQQQAPAPPPPTADPDVVEYAEIMSLYKPDGSGLDLEKAAKALAIAEKRTDRKAQATLQPYVEQTAQERSARNYQNALATTMPNGAKADQVALTHMWRALPAHLTADPQVATILQLAAIGASVSGQRPVVAPPPNAPLVSEPSGGQPRPNARLTELEKRVAASREMSETKWAELGTGFVAGRGSSLE